MKEKNLSGRKIRLDKLLVDRGIASSRERARALILSGIVLVEGNRIDKAGAALDPDVPITLKGEDNPYVSRGGLKLKGALEHFGIRTSGKNVLDVGASTGGFTDCLLMEGARKVYAVDVGYGQLAWKLRTDCRVVNIERTNIRYYSGQHIQEEIDLVTVDASFISLKLILPAVLRYIKEGGAILALIKPQFEAGRHEVGKKGVVRDESVHRKVVEEMVNFCGELNLDVIGTCESPLLGPAGNREFFIYAKKLAQG
jgi:23S rRNA (cytidine1920-2'-O)/16S rRNA (cytidine1409-2'-O)-methyltransferase